MNRTIILILLTFFTVCSTAQGLSDIIKVKAGDVKSLLSAIDKANEQNADTFSRRLFILIPDGIYDLGETSLTPILGHNIALIGQSMKGTVIMNAPKVEDEGIRTAILNVSFTCHMPDCLEMPYMPAVRGAKETSSPQSSYRLGGCSCLSGDYLGYWQFDHDLQIGENIIFEDMNHYTTVKTTMFNGVSHPDIALLHTDGTLETLRHYSYEDYRNRMD